MSVLGRREEALEATREAVVLLAPFFLRLPAAHAQRMGLFCDQYLKLSETVGVKPDAALFAPIVEALRKLQGSPDAGASNDA